MQTLDTEYLSQLKRENVLALDVATHCGFKSVHGHGTWYFPPTESAPKKLGKDYGQHKAFRTKILNYIVDNDIRVITVEDVAFSKFSLATRKLAELRGVLFELCESLDIPVVTFGVTDIKKFATGKGNADKDEMIAAAQNRWHIDVGDDDNAADACHIFFYFCKRYNL